MIKKRRECELAIRMYNIHVTVHEMRKLDAESYDMTRKPDKMIGIKKE